MVFLRFRPAQRCGARHLHATGREFPAHRDLWSRILGIAAREEAVRGYTADFVFFDEAARIADEVIDAALPMIAVRNGDWWMASTPNGKRGRFYELWASTDCAPQRVLKVMAAASENPRIHPQFVERARRERGELFVRQEFGCEFVENGQFVLNQEQVDKVFCRE